METFFNQLDLPLQTSLVSSLAVAYSGGVLASLTPCVYPMIPITAGVLGHANIGGSKLRGFFLCLTYVAGMALTYTALGVFAAATGRFFGAVNSNPWTFLLVGNIFLLFGLGMLGVFHLPLIGGHFSSRRQGLVGIFLAGVSSALVAGPCATPVLGTLLTYTATSQNLVTGGLLLFVFSLGLGTLLLGVGIFSGFLAAIPRSGAWMVKIQKTMGMVMLFLAEYFFIKAGALFL